MTNLEVRIKDNSEKKLRMKTVVDSGASTFGNDSRYWETHEEVDVGYYIRKIAFRTALGAGIIYGVFYLGSGAW